MLTGAILGGLWGIFAAFLGDVRASAGLLGGLVILGGLLSLWRPTRLLWQWGSTLAVMLVWLCLMTPVLRGPLQSLTLAQAPASADAIVVLGGGVQCGSAELESSSVARLMGGLKLWQAGYAPVITVSEQSGLIGPANCPKMSVLERQLVQQLYGTGGPKILTLPHVTTTRDEANRVSTYARERGWHRVLLVTSPSHSRRASAILTKYLAPLNVQVISVPTFESRFDQTLPTPPDRLFALRTLLYEGLSRLKASVGGTPER